MPSPQRRFTDRKNYRRLWALTALPFLAVAAASSSAALADAGNRVVANPTEVEIKRPSLTKLMENKAGQPELQTIPGKEALLNLNIEYSDPEVTKIFNPATNSYDKVKLRTYNGKLVAPTVRVRSGETVRMSLTNKLPACTGNDCLNSTNMHGHGLWVSPAGNSDNVLLSIQPGVSFQYEYNIPADHPSGLYWYHPHVHGSTAVQVASGMAGALIVEGSRAPTPDSPGDIDTILKDKQGKPFTERVLLLQQVQYACRDADGNIKTKKAPDGTVIAWVCDPGDVGTIEGLDQFGPGSWQQSNRYTAINGEIQPSFVDAEAGRIERWRVVHAGVRDTVNLAFLKMKPGAQPLTQAMGPAQQMWIKENCSEPDGGSDPALVQWELAADGQTHRKFAPLKTNVLQPGYRSDFLTVFPEAGTYCVVDRAANADSTINAHEKSHQLLAFVTVHGKGKHDDKAVILDTLTAAASKLPADVRKQVKDDLANDLSIGLFAPHKPIGESEVTGHVQNLLFSIGGKPGDFKFMVDHKSFNPEDFSRTVTLGTADEWTLTAANEIDDPNLSKLVISHPFHIHVNPFEIVRILNKDGKDVTDTSIPRATRLEWEGGDPQYVDLKGVWKDTVFVKQGYKVVMRTRYERYIGDFVLHCHILDHEDQGMMQMVRIAIPGGASAHASHSAH